MDLLRIEIGIMCGKVGYVGKSVFVRKIYYNVKIE
jgi:hypothetical protein